MAAGGFGTLVADTTRQILDRVIELGKAEIGKPYSGPIVGQPDSYRYGNPGYDCSSFVSEMYKRATNGAVKLVPFTDALVNQCTAQATPQAGDIVLYHYIDSSQPGVYWPHTGIWLSATEVLDARYPQGVGIHPHVTPVSVSANKFRRVYLPTALAGPVPPPPPPVNYETVLRTLTADQGGVLVALRDRKAHLLEEAKQIDNIINEIIRNRPPQ